VWKKVWDTIRSFGWIIAVILGAIVVKRNRPRGVVSDTGERVAAALGESERVRDELADSRESIVEGREHVADSRDIIDRVAGREPISPGQQETLGDSGGSGSSGSDNDVDSG